jgi:cell division protein FtsW (lipid II flippase)
MRNRKITLLGPEGTNISVFFLFLVFNFISWFTLFTLSNDINLDFSNILIRQIIFSLISISVFFLLTYISVETFLRFIDIFFVFTVLALLLLFTTEPRLGVRRWFDLGLIDLQPSEFAKVIIILFVAKYLSEKKFNFLILAGLILTVMLIINQPDLGTGIIITSVVVSMLFVTNIRLRYFLLIFLILILLFFVFLEVGIINENQLDRVNNFFQEEEVDFQQSQSRLSISSGGFFGQYFQENRVNKVFVPVETTDFIFSAYAYNFGFIGVASILNLVFKILGFSKKEVILSSSEFDKYVITGFIVLLSIQIIINISTVIGLVPNTGLPFPLLSLGGSSMVSIALVFGITNRIFIENNLVI